MNEDAAAILKWVDERLANTSEHIFSNPDEIECYKSVLSVLRDEVENRESCINRGFDDHETERLRIIRARLKL